MKYIAACVINEDTIFAADGEGYCHQITTEPGDKPYIDQQTSSTMEIREQAKSCTMYTILILEFLTFQILCQNITKYKNEWYREELAGTPQAPLIALTGLTYYGASAQQGDLSITLFYGHSGHKPGERWRCDTNRCPATNHYTCEHVQFAQQVIPIEAVTVRTSPQEDYSDLIDV